MNRPNLSWISLIYHDLFVMHYPSKKKCADIHLYDNSFLWHIHTIPTHCQKKASFIALLYIEECRLVISQQLLDLSCTDPLYFPLICRLWVKDETLFVCFVFEVFDHVPFFVARRARKLALSALVCLWAVGGHHCKLEFRFELANGLSD